MSAICGFVHLFIQPGRQGCSQDFFFLPRRRKPARSRQTVFMHFK